MEPPEFELCKLHQCWRKGKKCKQKCGKRQQELAVDVSHRASWDEAWKRYAARVFHNWSKDARGSVLPRSVHLWKDRLTAAVVQPAFWALGNPGGGRPLTPRRGLWKREEG